MNKYQNGKIYGVHCNITGDDYIGSTILSLHRRLKKHEYEIISLQRGTRTSICSIFDIIGRGDYEIYLIEDYPCSSETELVEREVFYQNSIPCVNLRRAKVEYNDEYWKEHYQRHKDKNKQWADEHKEEWVEYYKNHNKNWYEKNKYKVKCECGWEGMKYSLNQHKRLHKQHKEWNENKNK